MVTVLHRRSQLGRSLIELFVALAIGAVIIAAVLATIGSTGVTGRRTDVQARMTEDAQIAFSLMAPHLRMGASSLTQVILSRATEAAGGTSSRYAGPALMGCDFGFVNPLVGQGLVACAPDPGNGLGNASFSTFYEADQFNTLPVGGLPSDCLGRPIALQPPPRGMAGAFALAENRFYIAQNPLTGDPELFCAGSGAPAFANPVPLVGNVERMQLRYLVERAPPVAPAVQAYAPALTVQQLLALPPTEQWPRVTAVEVCLLMRSADRVAADATPYIDCNGVVITPADRRIRRAVVTTLQVRNGAKS